MAKGQFYFGTSSDTADRIVRVNDDGSGTTTVATNANTATFADNTTITVSQVWDVGLDTASGFYFSIIGNSSSTQGYLVRGSLGGGAQTVVARFDNNTLAANGADDPFVSALVVDPIAQRIYVGVQDNAYTATGGGIRQYSYTTGGVVTDLGFLVTTGQTNKASLSGDHRYAPNGNNNIFSVFDFDYVKATNTFFFTELETNSVFSFSANTPTIVTRLVNPAQFSISTLNANGELNDVEVDSVNGRVYFDSRVSAAGERNQAYTGAGEEGLWVLANNGASDATAQRVTVLGLPGGTVVHFGDMVYDAVDNRLYVESDGRNDSDADDVTYVFQMSPAGTSINAITATLIQTLPAGYTSGHGNIDGLTFNAFATVAGTTGPAYVEGGAQTQVFTDAAVGDIDGGFLTGATVSIGSGFIAGADRLIFVNTGQITGSYDSGTGVLTLNGRATLAQYEAALESIRFSTSGDNPTNFGSATTRTITTTVSDGSPSVPAGSSNSTTTTFAVTGVNDAPIVNGLAGDTATYTQGNNPVRLDTGTAATVGDVDSANFDGGSLTVSIAGSTAQDQLVIATSISTSLAGNVVSVSGSRVGTYSGGTNGTPLVITFDTDMTSPAAIQLLLRDIAYDNSDVGTVSGTRTVNWSLNDGDGTANGGVAVVNFSTSVNVIVPNAMPVNGVATASFTTAEDAAVAVTGLSVSDADATDQLYVTLSTGQGTLTIGTVTGVTVGNNSSATVTITSADRSALNTALGSLSFAPTADYNGAATVTIVTTDRSDGSGQTDTDTIGITVTPGQDTTSISETVTEDSGAINIPISLAGFEDPTARITSVSAHANTTAVLNNNGTPANYQDDYVVFTPGANYAGDGSFTYTVAAGGVSETGVATVAVTAVNDAPTVATTAMVNASEQAVTNLKGTTSIADVDAGAGAVTATLSVGYGILNATAGNSGVASVTGTGTGTITVTGTITQVNAFLASGGTSTLGYTPNTDAPPATTTLTVLVNDNGFSGVDTSMPMTGSGTSTIAIAAANDAPTLSAPTSAAVTYTEDGAATPLFAGTTLADPDLPAAFTGGGFSLVTTGEGGIDLRPGSAFAISGGTIVLAADPATVIGTVSGVGTVNLQVTGLTANATYARVQDLVDDFTYASASQNPTAGDRVVTLTFNDGGNIGGGALTATATQALTVVSVNDAPTLDLNGAAAGTNNTAAYTERQGPTILAPAIVVADVDNAMAMGATVRISAGLIANADMLTINGGTTGAVGPISFSYNATTGILALTGTATLAQYQSALSQVGFASTSSTPGDSRTIAWSVTDGTLASTPVSTTIAVTSIGEAPVGIDSRITASEDDAYAFATTDFRYSDVENDGFAGVVITTLPTVGTLSLDGAPVTAGSFVNAADIMAGKLTFLPAQDRFGTDYASFTFQVRDTGSTANGGVNQDATPNTMAIDVTADATMYTVAAVSVAEGDTGTRDLTFTVTRDGPTTTSDTLFVAYANGTAMAPSDYLAGPARVVIAAGSSSATFSVTVNGDAAVERDETLTVTVYRDADRVTPVAAATGTILNDDATYTIARAAVGEGDVVTTSLTFTVTRSGPTDFATRLYAQPVSGTATAGDDFATAVQTVDFAKDQTTATFTIAIVGDTLVEGQESFTVNLYNDNTGGTLSILRATGAGTIVDNDLDPPPAGTPTSGNDILVSNGNSPTTLSGGSGNDTYVIGNPNTTITEQVNGGNDIVYASVSYALNGGAFVETLSTQSQRDTDPINLTGNFYAQQVVGNFGNNVLNGNGGADTLIGLKGDDIYAIADANAMIVENPNEGYDLVYTQVSYTLTGTAAIEELSFATQGATDNFNIIGNGFDQKIIGNYGNNVLNGNGGVDTLIGLLGDDTYVVGDTHTVVIEGSGEGFDTVYANTSYALSASASIEMLSTATQRGTEAYDLTGNGFAQAVIGNNGVNVLNGGGGADTLYGLGGNDTFAFTSTPGDGTVVTIADFGNGADRISLSATVFTGIATGALSASNFVVGSAATTADQHIIYNQTTGQLFYDVDGSGAGAAVLFATVTPGTVITADMITVG